MGGFAGPLVALFLGSLMPQQGGWTLGEKALSLDADAVILDLEDAVADPSLF